MRDPAGGPDLRLPHFSVLGYRTAKELKGIAPESPALTMEELLSYAGFARLARENSQQDALAARYGRLLGLGVRRLLAWDYWRGVQRIYVGGGLSRGAAGEAIIAAARDGIGTSVEVRLLPDPPDVAGLLGAAWLIQDGRHSFVAVDLGGTNMRIAVIERESTPRILQGSLTMERHADSSHTRETLVARLADLIAQAQASASFPLVCIGCPGTLDPTGAIVQGARNLPGAPWIAPDFHLRAALQSRLPSMELLVFNDAVIHGASAFPHLDTVAEWGVLTLGTGVGNARFSKKH